MHLDRRVQVVLIGLCAVLASACRARTGGAGAGTGPAPASGPSRPPTPEPPLPQPEAAATLDTLTFGDPASEWAHALTSGFSPVQATVDPIPVATAGSLATDTVAGQLGLTARRLLPRTPNPDYYGGELTFRMAVDPVKLNHFTVKTWGADASSTWLVLNVEGYELGWRHDYQATDERMFLDVNGWLQGGFVYRTERLPFHVTRGKTSVTITLRTLGEIHFYAAGAYDVRQTRMRQPSVPLYAAYTHTGAQLDAAGERQGPGASGTPRSDDADAAVASWRRYYDGVVQAKLTAAPSSLTPDDLDLLAQAYGTPWTSGFANPAVVAQVRDGLDALVAAYAAAPATYVGGHGNDSWGGYLGSAGAAVRLLWEPLSASTDLDVDVDYAGSLGRTTRRDAWGTALRASVDWGRFHRNAITNQALYAARTLYRGNSGLLLLDPARAIKESEAKRYLYEAAGIWPWKGDDQPGGGDTPVPGTAPMGPDWYMVTSDGTAKEPCLVGGDYGEIGGEILRWALDTGDPLLQAQAIKLLRARLALRHPWVDGNGVASMIAVEPIGCRNAQEIGWHVAYLGRASADLVRAGALGVGVLGADLLGALQQAKADGQLVPRPGGAGGYFGALALPDAYDAFKALAPTGRKVPMSAGEPDFAWADRENMVVAAKHGEERFWAALDWGCAVAMNRLARVFTLEGTHATLAEVGLDDVQYTPAGRLVVASDRVEGDGALTPPDHPVNVNVGQLFPAARRADLSAEPPQNRDAGRADAYTLRYGHWLVGLNAHPTRPYPVRTPAGFASAVDLASGRTLAGPVILPPRSYAVFYLDSATAAAAGAANPVRLTALPEAGGVRLGWDATPGGASYDVHRAAAADGPYEVVATGLLGTTSLDPTATTTAFYRVHAVDGRGFAGGPSPVASAAPPGGALGDGWAHLDVGAVTTTGTAARTASGVTVAGSGADIWGAADGFHFVFRSISGDATLTARVVSQGATNAWAKAGLMVREGLGDASRQVMMAISPGNGAQLNWRSWPGGGTAAANLAGFAAPAWVRLVRSGTTFTGYVSSDGSAWTKVGSTEVVMPELVHVGLAASAHTTDGRLSAVEFDQLAVPPLP